jgi:hypothetical protein
MKTVTAMEADGAVGIWFKWSDGGVINDSERVAYFAMARDGQVKGHTLVLAPGTGLSHDAPMVFGFDRLLLLPQITQHT